jgi:TPR repeat protein
LALLYRSTAFGETGYENAVHYLSEIVNSSHPEELGSIYSGALFYMALHYHHGQGVIADKEKARVFFERARDSGSVTAERELAYMDIVDGKKVKGYWAWFLAIVNYLRVAFRDDKSSIAGW